MKKIIISLISIVLLSGALCPVWAQKDNPMAVAMSEIKIRTNFKAITEQDFKFPSPSEAAKVFAGGKELLLKMEYKSNASRQIDYRNKDMIPYLPPDLIEYEVNNSIFNPYEIIQSEVKGEHNNQDLKHYQDFYKQIVWKDDGTPDLTKAATAKAYLAFYYLIHNNGKPSSLQVGRIDEHFPLLGVYADSFKELQERFGKNDAYLLFMDEIYLRWGRQQMIPQEYDKKAEEIAKQMLYSDFNKYGFTENQVDQWMDFATSWKNYDIMLFGGIVNIGQRAQGNWYNTIYIRPDLQKGNKYLIALHEFHHVKEMFPGVSQIYSLSELTTAIKDIVLYDSIRREISGNIPDMQPIKYKHEDYDLGIDLGEIALFFRNLSKKYNTDNYAKLLLTQEAIDYINKTYDEFLEKGILQELKNSGYNIPISPERMKELKEANRSVVRQQVEQEIKKYILP